MADIIVNPAQSNVGKPQMPTEPTKEAKEMKFEFNPSLISESGESTITIDKKPVEEIKPEVKIGEEKPKVDDTKPKEEVKVEEKPKEEIEKEKKKTGIESVLKAPKDEKKVEQKKEEVKKEVIKPITPLKKDEQDTFDYTKYSTEQQQILKQMSNTAKKEYAKVIDENKQLAALKDSQYLQHEQGYTLSPEFQQLQQKQYFAQKEAEVWEQALLNIKAGKPFQDIVGWNQDGSPKLSNEIPFSDKAEIRVNNNLSKCLNVYQQLNGELQTFPQQFKQRIQLDQQAINQYEKEHFSWVANPELLEHTVEIEGVGDRKLKDIINDVKNMFPSYERNSTGARMSANLVVGLMIRTAELKAAQNTQQVSNIKKEESERVEVSSDHREVTNGSHSNGNVPKEFNLDPKLLESMGMR